jgi:AraC-like DNA-binding protein
MSYHDLTSLVRTENLLGIHEVISELGGNTEAFFEDAGLKTSILDTTNSWIGFHAFTALLKSVSEALDCPHLGLLLAAKQQPLPLGAYGQLLLRSHNLSAAFKLSTQYRALHSQAVDWQLKINDQQAMMIRHYKTASCSTVQHSLYSLLKLYLMTRELLGKNWQATGIYFSHSAPEHKSLYLRHFQCPVYFDQEFDGMICPAHDLEKTLPTSDSNLLSILQNYTDQLLSQSETEGTTSSQARQLIQQTMASGNCTLEAISAQLLIHPMELYRRLKAEKITFRSLLKDVRQDTAFHFLGESEISLTELAQILGYSELSAFSRAFFRHNGLYPVQWREKNRRG